MNILMVYPQYPDTYWSFKHALRFISKKAAVPPLGLITVSPMLPDNWKKKLVDMNVSPLNTEDIQWADYVFLSAMYIQKQSVNEVIERCQQQETKIIAGGPLFTQEYDNYPQIDHFILNEAEITLPEFLKDLNEGHSLKRLYQSGTFPNITSSPIPDYHLLSMKDYALMNIQVTRGCPFDCEFCEITSLFGHKVRMKATEQVLRELKTLYDLNWRGTVSIVDDNFIGRKKAVKEELLPAMKNWMEQHHYPFSFNIQSSINLADDEELLSLMVDTGFHSAFIGIETPDEETLSSCNKVQNRNKDMVESVRNLQRAGMQVSGGFIVGFDSDQPNIFQRQIDFIQNSGIVSAMVGILNAPKNTRLYQRLSNEKRLTTEATGNNTDLSINFKPKMNYDTLLEGYNKIIQNIYAPKPYYRRVRRFLTDYKPPRKKPQTAKISLLPAFIKSMIIIGIIDQARSEYWKLLFWTLFKRPGLIPEAITFAVYGYHFKKVYALK